MSQQSDSKAAISPDARVFPVPQLPNALLARETSSSAVSALSVTSNVQTSLEARPFYQLTDC
jgi:hypothetical protein